MKRALCAGLLALLIIHAGALAEEPGFSKPGFDFDPMMKSLAAKKYDAVYAWLDASLQKVWSKQSFAADVGAIRDALGAGWKTERTGFMNSRAPRGPVCSAAYKLTSAWNSKYVLELVALDAGEGFKIVGWTMSTPCAQGDAAVPKARKAASKYLAHLQKEEYDLALGMMSPLIRRRVSKPLLAQIRRIFWTGGGELEFKKMSLLKLINGKTYYSVTAFPKRDGATYLEVILEKLEKGMSVASFGFKGRAPGPGQ